MTAEVMIYAAEVAAALNRRLMWEFDEYRPFKSPS